MLHKKAIRYVSANAQAYVVDKLFDENFFSEQEMAIYKRGRNADSNTVPKNTELSVYKKATGYEALIGAIYLEEKTERLDELIYRSIEITNERIGAKDE